MKKTSLKMALFGITMAATMIVGAKVSAYSANVVLDADSKILKAGTTYTVTAEVKDIDAGEGIKGMTAKLEYDKNVFEEVTFADFLPTKQWKAADYSSSPLLIIESAGTGRIKENTVTMKMQIKTKSNVEAESAVISLKNIVVSGGTVNQGGTGDIKVADASLILAKEGATPTPTPSATATPTTTPTPSTTGTPTTTPTPSTTGTPTTTPTSNATSTPTSTTKPKGELPKAGINVIIIEVVAIIVAVGVIFYIRYTKLKKSEK